MLLAFCSIIYELLLANTLAIVTGNYIWWQSLTIGIFIGGLGAGAFLSDKLKDAHRNIVKVEIALSFLGASCAFLIYLLHGGYKFLENYLFYAGNFHSPSYVQDMFVFKIIFFIMVQTITFSIGLLSGFEIPLMVKIAEIRIQENKMEKEKNEHEIFGFNYLGTLVGTLFFSYLLLPKFDVIKTSLIVAFLNLLVCLYFMSRYPFPKKTNYFLAMFGVFIWGSWIACNEELITQRYLKVFYYMPKIMTDKNKKMAPLTKKIDELPKIERMKSLYQYLDIFSYPTETREFVRDATILTLDTNFQFSTETEFLYHEGFAHASIAINKQVPKKVLLLGGGDGLLLRELVKYEEIKEIDFIELDEKMLELARGRFSKINKDSLKNPKIKIHINDGFYYLRNTKEKYDAIFIDFPYPNSYDLARLYSVEFYKYVARALNENGFVVLDAPFFDKESEIKDNLRGQILLTTEFGEKHVLNNSVMASTIYYAGFKTIFPYIVAEESFLFLKKKPDEIDYDFMEKANLSKLSPETVRKMSEIKNQNFPYSISSKYINSIFHPVIAKKNAL